MFSIHKALGPLALAFACAAAPACALQPTSDEDGSEVSEDAITDVPQSVVERQAIGNCWIYAHASWLESMNLKATGKEFDSSQTYVTYWHWFEQVVNGEIDGEKEISTGGWFRTANYLVTTYGVAAEKDFAPSDADAEMSTVQKNALTKVNQELSTGRLATDSARRDRKLVRQVLDEAFGLSPAVRAQLDKVFGKTVARNLTTKSRTTGKLLASTANTFVIRASSFKTAYTRWDATAKKSVPVSTTLDVAAKEWREVSYPTWTSGRRDVQIRLQRALHDAQPVPLSWFVDFNALSSSASSGSPQGSFTKALLDKSGPGRQGGHMTVFEDYEVTLPSGEVLAAGTTLDASKPADKAKLDAALSPSAKIRFYRIKNSWGAARLDRGFVPGMGGYHDLYADYIDGPLKSCTETENEKPLAERGCTSSTPGLRAVYLPPGY